MPPYADDLYSYSSYTAGMDDVESDGGEPSSQPIGSQYDPLLHTRPQIYSRSGDAHRDRHMLAGFTAASSSATAPGSAGLVLSAGHGSGYGGMSLDGGNGVDNEDHFLSPTDGYFRGAGDVSSISSLSLPPTSRNVWVEDPSLPQGSTAESKAREAERERTLLSGGATSDEARAVQGTGLLPDAASRSSPSEFYRQVGGRSPTPSSARTSLPSSASYYVPSRDFHRQQQQHQSASSSSSRSTTHYRPSSSSTYTSPSAAGAYRWSPRRPEHYGRYPTTSSSLLHQTDEAPPAYTPSPTSPTGSGEGSTSPVSGSGSPRNNYQTFSVTPASSVTSLPSTAAMGRRQGEEARGLLTNMPESMASSAAGDYEDVTPVWRERVRRRVPFFHWRTCKMVLLCLVLFLVTIGFLTAFVTSVREEREKELNRHKNNNSDSSNQDSSTNPPLMRYPALDDYGFEWSSSLCKNDKIVRPVQHYPLIYGTGHSLTLTQDIRDDNHDDNDHPLRDVHVSGEVILRRLPDSDTTETPSITVAATTNDDRVVVTYEWDAGSQALRILVPRSLPWLETSARPCLNIRATIWAPPDAALDNLALETVHLAVLLMDNLALQVASQTNLVTVVGRVVAATDGASTPDRGLVTGGAPASFRFASRHIEVKTTSAPIAGAWPLYDYLGLQTTSGTIAAGIDPKEAKKGGGTAEPATLYIKSLSGDVEFREPIESAAMAFAAAVAAAKERGGDALLQGQQAQAPVQVKSAERYIPPRDYRVDVRTTSGKITGSAAFSSVARFHSTSGDMALELLPVFDSSMADDHAREASLETSSTSGKLDLKLLEAMWVDAKTKGYVEVVLPVAEKKKAEKPGDEKVIPIGDVGDGDPYNMLPPVAMPTKVPEVKPQPPQLQQRASNESVSITSPSASAPAAMRCLRSRHSATSADIKLRYPAVWEGELQASSTAGTIKVGGKGVQIIREGNEWPGFNRYVVARKGENAADGSQLVIKTTSGRTDVVIGEE